MALLLILFLRMIVKYMRRVLPWNSSRTGLCPISINDAHLFDPEVLKAGGYEMLDKGEATDPFIIGLLSKFMAQQRRLQQLIQIETTE